MSPEAALPATVPVMAAEEAEAAGGSVAAEPEATEQAPAAAALAAEAAAELKAGVRGADGKAGGAEAPLQAAAAPLSDEQPPLAEGPSEAGDGMATAAHQHGGEAPAALSAEDTPEAGPAMAEPAGGAPSMELPTEAAAGSTVMATTCKGVEEEAAAAALPAAVAADKTMADGKEDDGAGVQEAAAESRAAKKLKRLRHKDEGADAGGGDQAPAAAAGSKAWKPAVGDLVWARIKSHPWWPGQVFDPSNASRAAQKLRKPGHLLVAFFGDGTFQWLQIGDLVPFRPHIKEKAQQTNAKLFQKAVTEALEELEEQQEARKAQKVDGLTAPAETATMPLPELFADVDPVKLLEDLKAFAASPLHKPLHGDAVAQLLAIRRSTRISAAVAGAASLSDHLDEDEGDADLPSAPQEVAAEADIAPAPEPVQDDSVIDTTLEDDKEVTEEPSAKKKRGRKKGDAEDTEEVQKKRQKKLASERAVEAADAEGDESLTLADLAGRLKRKRRKKKRRKAAEAADTEPAVKVSKQRKESKRVTVDEDEEGARPFRKRLKKLYKCLLLVARQPSCFDDDNKVHRGAREAFICFRDTVYAKGSLRERPHQDLQQHVPMPASVPADKDVDSKVTRKKPAHVVSKPDAMMEDEPVARKVDRSRVKDGSRDAVKNKEEDLENNVEDEHDYNDEETDGDRDEDDDEDEPEVHERGMKMPSTATDEQAQVPSLPKPFWADGERRTAAVDEEDDADRRASESQPAKQDYPLGLYIQLGRSSTQPVPSENQLKANFARFGKILPPPDGVRVFRSARAAQVVFARSRDCDAAVEYARKSRLYGGARFSTRPYQDSQNGETEMFSVKQERSPHGRDYDRDRERERGREREFGRDSSTSKYNELLGQAPAPGRRSNFSQPAKLPIQSPRGPRPPATLYGQSALVTQYGMSAQQVSPGEQFAPPALRPPYGWQPDWRSSAPPPLLPPPPPPAPPAAGQMPYAGHSPSSLYPPSHSQGASGSPLAPPLARPAFQPLVRPDLSLLAPPAPVSASTGQAGRAGFAGALGAAAGGQGLSSGALQGNLVSLLQQLSAAVGVAPAKTNAQGT
eukprot:SM000201S05932  [mRNA]  locus=s201:161708:167388:- [translate_table: standard]